MNHLKRATVFLGCCVMLTGCQSYPVADEASFDTQQISIYAAGGSQKADSRDEINAIKICDITDTYILSKIANMNIDCEFDEVDDKEKQEGTYSLFLRFNNETVMGMYLYEEHAEKTNDYGYISDRIEQNAKPVWLPNGVAKYIKKLLNSQYDMYSPKVQKVLKHYGINGNH